MCTASPAREVGWSVALPEFEGLIEPILVGVSSQRGDGRNGVRKAPGCRG